MSAPRQLTGIFVFSLLLASNALAAQKVKTSTNVTTPVSVALTTTAKPSTVAPHTLAFNFVGLSQGKTNIYFDVGGLGERVSPSLSYRAYSNKEKRKDLRNEKFTVDRNLATLGASIKVLDIRGKSLLVNPYLFFGSENDAVNTTTKSGLGARLVGQAQLNKVMAIQAGIDGNSMEDTFKGDIYIGMAFTL